MPWKILKTLSLCGYGNLWSYYCHYGVVWQKIEDCLPRESYFQSHHADPTCVNNLAYEKYSNNHELVKRMH